MIVNGRAKTMPTRNCVDTKAQPMKRWDSANTDVLALIRKNDQYTVVNSVDSVEDTEERII